MTDLEHLLPPAFRARYELGARLGEGATSVVVRATDRERGRDVAVKVFRPEAADPRFRERFLAEAKILEGLRHPACVELLEHGAHGDALYSVYAYLEGRSLREELAARGALPVSEALALTDALLDGLAFVHTRGVVHRDLKPANVFLAEAGGVRILDFGCARTGTERRGMTATGEFVGTPAYGAPDQVLGHTVDPRDDLYSVGVIAYEVLTGVNPMLGEDLPATLQRQLGHVPDSPATLRPEISRPVATLVRDLLEKDRDDRPPDAAAALELLRRARDAPAATGPPPPRPEATARVESTAPQEPPPPAPGPAAGPGARRSRAPWAVAAAVLLGIAGSRGGGDPGGTAPPLASAAPEPASAPGAGPTAFPEDYGARLKAELEDAKTWTWSPAGEVVAAAGPTVGDGAPALFLDSDPLRYGAILRALPEVTRFLTWASDGGHPEDLPVGLLEELREVDRRYVAEGLMGPFGPHLDPAPAPGIAPPPAALQELLAREDPGLAIPTHLGPWAREAATRLLQAAEALAALKAAFKADPAVLPRALNLPGAGPTDFDQACYEMGGTARSRRALARFLAPAVPPTRRALLATGRSSREEPATRDFLAVLFHHLGRRLETMWPGPLVDLDPVLAFGEVEATPAGAFLAASLATWTHLDLDSPRSAGRDAARDRVLRLCHAASREAGDGEASRRRRDLARVLWMEAAGGEARRPAAIAMVRGLRPEPGWARPEEEATFLLALARLRASWSGPPDFTAEERAWLRARLAASAGGFTRNQRRELARLGDAPFQE